MTFSFFSYIYTWPEILRLVYIIQGSRTLPRNSFKNNPLIRLEHFPTQMSWIIAYLALNPRCMRQIFCPAIFAPFVFLQTLHDRMYAFPHIVPGTNVFPRFGNFGTGFKCFSAIGTGSYLEHIFSFETRWIYFPALGRQCI